MIIWINSISRVCSADSYTLLTEQCSAFVKHTDRSRLPVRSVWSMDMCKYDSTGQTPLQFLAREKNTSPVDVSWTDDGLLEFWLLCRDSEAFRLNTATVEGSILSWVNSGVAIDLGTDDVSFLRSEHAHLTGSVSVCHLTANHPTMHDWSFLIFFLKKQEDILVIICWVYFILKGQIICWVYD